MSIPNRSFLFRHKLISLLRDLDVKGIRRLSIALPKLLLPNPSKVGKHVLKTIHGVKMVIDPSVDTGVELSLFQTGTYEKGTIQLLQKYLNPGNTFLDIGANIGLMSVIASKVVGEKGIVYSVEANPKTVPILQVNSELNACENIVILPIALSDSKGMARLFENWEVNRGGASLISQSNEQQGIEVKMERLDDLFQKETPLQLVKIDVEGFEPQVLRGGMSWFQKQQPIFIIEVSKKREKEVGPSPAEIMKLVQTIGKYSFFKQKGTKERRGKLIEIQNEQDLPSHDNIVCIPAAKNN
ncbi:FkbM family methyltransferase [Fluviicola taffensis]|uniref:Methyltransferase FkbM family n=1 Tax=Fluviicola taffensis (strain DSM 16823 / NCIMB 13979 / RW262) TaxID=755732 RepID=F2IG67_FLUTR|nr:FkbM family methyltransferase [Fluviicola taffensis]AEA44702.1 methyltransferase FkbM family [Fluviicola taffensis DSM 16823]